ncbi:MAG TPA: nuclease-related domain-containing protein [Methanocorpusculum sp.]|nr:nuclease-related domain-containing protein [Methanocorpusculum sp.]HJJ59771.1 nuclease-related domain-containing protein [Methanocorpusculum sp.]
MQQELKVSRWTYVPSVIFFILGAAALIIPPVLYKSVSVLTLAIMHLYIPLPFLPEKSIPVTFLGIGIILLLIGGVLLFTEIRSRKNRTAEISGKKLRILRRGKVRAEISADDVVSAAVSGGLYDRITNTVKITVRAKVPGKKADRIKTFRLGRVADAAVSAAAFDSFRGIKRTQKRTAKKEEAAKTAKAAKETDTAAKKAEKTGAAKTKTEEKKTAAKSAAKSTAAASPKKRTKAASKKDAGTDAFEYPDIRETRQIQKTEDDTPVPLTEAEAKAEYLRRTAGSEKGAAFEDEVDSLLQKRDAFPCRHRALKSLYIPYGDGSKRLSEIDNIVIAETGVYVFECKNYSGTILGKKDERNWTVVYDSGEMRQFYSPILQNKGHIRSISDLLGIPREMFASVIVFSGHTNLNGVKYPEENTYVFCIDTLAAELRKKTASAKKVLSAKEVDEIYGWILPYTETSFADRVKHLNYVEKLAEKEEG